MMAPVSTETRASQGVDSAMTNTGPGPVSRRREVEVISLMTLAKFPVTTDFYIMSLILPAIARGLHLSQVMVSWVIAAPGVFYAGFMVLRSDEHTSELQSL